MLGRWKIVEKVAAEFKSCWDKAVYNSCGSVESMQVFGYHELVYVKWYVCERSALCLVRKRSVSIMIPVMYLVPRRLVWVGEWYRCFVYLNLFQNKDVTGQIDSALYLIRVSKLYKYYNCCQFKINLVEMIMIDYVTSFLVCYYV